MKNILVTGGAGFIGSNLCKKLLDDGNRVVCLDNFITGSKNNISSCILNPNFTLFEGDICNYEDCKKSVTEIDYVFHQAALGSVPRSIKDPILTTNTNISGFVNILFASVEANVKRFIYAASSSTYGDSMALPKIENEIGTPLSPYGITKYTNELYAENFSKIYSLETVGLRYFNVFGKNQSPNGAYAAVIPKFVIQLINHESPIINGDGSFSRDFTYIDNVIQANLLAMNTNSENLFREDIKHEVFNVAFGESTSLNQLFNILKKNLAKFDNSINNIEPIYGPERKGDIPHSLASIDKAQKYLNYSPRHDIQSGIKKACEWYWETFKK